MSQPLEESLNRFRRRTDPTDEATLRRNLAAGVYGPPGSPSRVVAERALTERFHETARVVQVAGASERDALVARVEEARRTARRATWLAGGSLVVGLLALAFALGWI